MEPKAPAQVCWIYASEDEPTARELLRLASVLEGQGLIENTTLVDIERNELGGSRSLLALVRLGVDVAEFEPHKLRGSPWRL